MSRKIVVTSALPYANGAIHIGHLVEYLQTDFWVRFQKMRGNECVYICADDTHGTPIMIRARQEGVSPESIIEHSYVAHTKDFADFEVAFENYHTTNCDENRGFSNSIFQAMERGGFITSTPIQQFYCEHDQMFLPDRFVKGVCPKCNAPNQYGDSCDACAATYGADELKEPFCSVCSKPPVKRDSEQLFFELEPFREFLKAWIPAHTAPDVANKLLEWFNEPLRGWNISRDAPYFGFEIPGHPGKYFYVWMDAPIGYMASLQNWCSKHGKDFAQYWENPQAELYHFIGKDIVRFHSLFWPAMLHCAGHKTPDQIFVHGFLTVNGEKMSKSKGTFISARTYLNHLPAYYLRFYYACKLNGTTDDMDLNLDDFVNRVNSDLVGKITNLASRGAQMLHKNFAGQATTMDDAGRALLARFRAQANDIAAAYENRDFCRVMVFLREMADEANQYFDAQAPWALVKTNAAQAQQVLTATLNHFRYFAIALKPILPAYAQQAEALFGDTPWAWGALMADWEDRAVAPYTYLATRIDPAAVEAMIAESKPKEAPPPAPAVPIKATIDYDAFDKVDLRVARILTAEAVEGSDKLLKVTADIGEAKPRQILAGIKSAYKPEDLIGKRVVIVANLAPRKMRFGISEGMILAASNPNGELFVTSPDGTAEPGGQVK